MQPDVIDLRDFYKRPLGRHTTRVLTAHLKKIWPSLRSDTVIALGYGVPYLNGMRNNALRTIAVMPAGQGVLRWPHASNNLTVLAHESALPLPDISIDKLLVIHCLESTPNPRQLLRECWRVLADGGSMVIVVPNRRGLWARSENSPFGRGVPYSRAQLDTLLRETLFTPVHTQRALFVPPTRSRFWLSTAPLWQRLGEKFFPRFSGIVMIEAHKQLYAGTPAAEKAAPRLRPAMEGTE